MNEDRIDPPTLPPPSPADSAAPSGELLASAVSDAELERLFEKAVKEHSRRLLAVARGIVGNRASPEDVVQQAMMNLYRHRRRYDWREPGGLLRRAVVNEALRLLRQPRMAAMEEDYHVGHGDAPDAAMIGSETVVQVRRAIDKLPEHFRSALVLCEYEQMPYAQIAQTLGASVPQVKTWIFRARRQLAEMLKGLADPNGTGAAHPQ
jgi:RNA polymerase sigma-70 factor (ECF subfamily)